MNKLTVFCAVACLTTSAAAQNYPDLYEILDRQKGQSLVEIPKGTYTLDVRNNGPYKFHNLTDVHINGNGSTVICSNQEQAFSFYNCVRVELRDLTIDYDPLCFTQGEITAVAEDGSWFDVRIDKGYPVTGLAANRVQFYDPQTRLLKRNSITTYTSNYSELKQLGHNLFRAVKNGTWSAGEQVGDLVVMDVKTDKPNARRPYHHAQQVLQHQTRKRYGIRIQYLFFLRERRLRQRIQELRRRSRPHATGHRTPPAFRQRRRHPQQSGPKRPDRHGVQGGP
ncbi:MAG: hypothetical protein ACLSH3_00425 [Alistipes finegoldii]